MANLESDHITPEVAERLLTGALDASESAAVDAHLEACDACFNALATFPHPEREPAPAIVQWLLDETLREEHLAFYEMRDHLAGDLDLEADRRVRKHLSRCETCFREVQDLMEIERQIEQALAEEELTAAELPPSGQPDAWVRELQQFLANQREQLSQFTSGLQDVQSRLEARLTRLEDETVKQSQRSEQVVGVLQSVRKFVEDHLHAPAAPLGPTKRSWFSPPAMQAFAPAAAMAAVILAVMALQMGELRSSLSGVSTAAAPNQQALDGSQKLVTQLQSELRELSRQKQDTDTRSEAAAKRLQSRIAVLESRLRSQAVQPATPVRGGAVPDETLLAGGGVRWSRYGDQWRQEVTPEESEARALRAELPPIRLAMLDPGPIPRGARVQVRAPNGSNVRTARPILSWQKIAGADHYSVRVYQNGKVVETVEGVRDSYWQPRTVRAGEAYEWDLLAFREGSTTPIGESAKNPGERATFRVLSDVESREIDQRLARAGVSLLAHIPVLVEFGLLSEAWSAADELRAENPRSAVPRRLSKQIQSLQDTGGRGR